MTARTAQAARMAQHAQDDVDRAKMIGRARSHIAWALAAAQHGNMHDMEKYLHRAADALGVDAPTNLYVPVTTEVEN